MSEYDSIAQALEFSLEGGARRPERMRVGYSSCAMMSFLHEVVGIVKNKHQLGGSNHQKWSLTN